MKIILLLCSLFIYYPCKDLIIPNPFEIKNKVKVVLKSNVFRGSFYLVKKKLLSIKSPSIINLDDISVAFNAELISKKVSEFLDFHPSDKILLKNIADDFVENRATVYGFSLKLEDYTISKFSDNLNRKELFNKEVRFHWEIYRAKFLFHVGLTYFLTKNEKYSKALKKYILNWRAFSPISDSRIVYNGMEASLKIINLSMIHLFIKDSEEYTKEVRKELIVAILEHAAYVYQNYEITSYGLESNHGLSCGVGLVYVALLFPNNLNSKKWYSFGIKVIKRAMHNQFNDGINYESSIQYHRYTFEIMLIVTSALYNSEKKDVDEIATHVKKIGDALYKLRHTNGFIPRVGDSDSGKVLYDLGSTYDFNSLEYLNWFEAKNKSVFFETLIFESIPGMKNLVLEQRDHSQLNRYFVYKNERLSVLVIAHEIGTNGKGNHQHNDFLSFELYSKKPFIVDSWSYCYTSDRGLRDNDRKTKNHNTVVVDDREIIEFLHLKTFELFGSIKTKIINFHECDNYWEVEVEHNGYKRLNNGGQMHLRRFEFNKKENRLDITDTLSGMGSHKAAIMFHVPQEYWTLNRVGNTIVFANDKETFSLKSNNGEIVIREGNISDYFLSRKDSYIIEIDLRYTNSVSVTTTICYSEIKN